jgi:hypothetical protein
VATGAEVLRLYREHYQGFNVAHFCDQWRGRHPQRRARRPRRGLLLYGAGSTHAWIPSLASARFDLVAVLDAAHTDCDYAQLVEQERTLSGMAALREVLETHGLFGSLSTDRGSHFFHPPQAGGPVDKSQLTASGRALAQLGIEHIPSDCPQGRGRLERFFGSWPGRWPQEPGQAGLTTLAAANRYIRQKFLSWPRRPGTEPPRQKVDAFGPYGPADWDAVFCVQHERSGAADNTVTVKKRRLQIAPQASRWSYAKCRGKVCEHLDGRGSVRYGPHRLGGSEFEGQAIKGQRKQAA